MKFPCIPQPDRYTLRDLHRQEGFEHSAPLLAQVMHERAPSAKQTETAIMQLLGQSVVEHSDTLMSYIEAGQDEVNLELRQLKPDKKISTDLRDLMQALSQQTPFKGTAYRALHVTPSGAETLRHIGTCVMDEGLQSASTLKGNIDGWLDWSQSLNERNGKSLTAVVMVFSPDTPKANLASGLLPDHVGVPPMTPLIVRDWRNDDAGRLWCHVSPASENHLGLLFNPYNGTARTPHEARLLQEQLHGSTQGFSFAAPAA